MSNDNSELSNDGFIMWFIATIAVVAFLFFVIIMPLRNQQQPTQTNVNVPAQQQPQQPNVRIPDKIDVNINQTAPTPVN